MKFKKGDRVYHQHNGHGTVLYLITISFNDPDSLPKKYARDGEEGYLVDFDSGVRGKLLYVDLITSTKCCPKPILSLTNSIGKAIYTCSNCLKQA
jgi:hypothetical protein